MSTQSLIYPMRLAPAMEGGLWFLAVGIAISLGLLFWLSIRHPRQLFRPATMMAGLTLSFYSIPALLYAQHWYPLFQNPWFLVSNAAIPPLLLGYASISRRYWRLGAMASKTFSLSDIPPQWHSLLALLPWLVTLAIYLAAVPLECTALAALRSDPSAMLLARELSLKWLGSTPASYAYAMLVSCTAPFALWALLEWARTSALPPYQRLLSAIACIGVLGSLLLTGAKGNIIPTAIFLMGAWVCVARSPWHAIREALIATTLIVVSLYMMEHVQATKTQTPYPLTSCVKRLNQCERALNVFQSMTRPAGALGLQQSRIKQLHKELALACLSKQKLPSAILIESENSNKSSIPIIPATSIIKGIAYRAFVTPMQVASWYFLDRLEQGPRGWTAIPMIARVTGTQLNMPETVYQRYGSVYSAGDTTLGSTAPTSYLMGYPAYLGMMGLTLAVLLVVGLDGAACIAVRFAPPGLAPAIVGFCAMASVNSMSSDFFTVLLTHGAGLAGLLTACAIGFNYVQGRRTA